MSCLLVPVSYDEFKRAYSKLVEWAFWKRYRLGRGKFGVINECWDRLEMSFSPSTS